MAAKGAQRGISAISRSRSGTPCTAARAACTSILSFAISTPVGHSRLQPLQETHSAIASAVASEARPPGNCPVSASRSVFARPRVRCCSSCVARKLGHMTLASDFRQVPLLLHISTAPSSPPWGPGQADQSSAGVIRASAAYSGW